MKRIQRQIRSAVVCTCANENSTLLSCMSLMRSRKQDVNIRFWSKVDKTKECWEWTAVLHPSGYGLFAIWDGVRTNIARAHRWSWEYTHGPIVGGLWVLHKCDNPKCVRPDHLFLGTPQDNIDDMFSKNRFIPRSRSLPANVVSKILYAYEHNNVTTRELARMYSTSKSTVGDIVKRGK